MLFKNQTEKCVIFIPLLLFFLSFFHSIGSSILGFLLGGVYSLSIFLFKNKFYVAFLWIVILPFENIFYSHFGVSVYSFLSPCVIMWFIFRYCAGGYYINAAKIISAISILLFI